MWLKVGWKSRYFLLLREDALSVIALDINYEHSRGSCIKICAIILERPPHTQLIQLASPSVLRSIYTKI